MYAEPPLLLLLLLLLLPAPGQWEGLKRCYCEAVLGPPGHRESTRPWRVALMGLGVVSFLIFEAEERRGEKKERQWSPHGPEAFKRFCR